MSGPHDAMVMIQQMLTLTSPTFQILIERMTIKNQCNFDKTKETDPILIEHY